MHNYFSHFSRYANSIFFGRELHRHRNNLPNILGMETNSRLIEKANRDTRIRHLSVNHMEPIFFVGIWFRYRSKAWKTLLKSLTKQIKRVRVRSEYYLDMIPSSVGFAGFWIHELRWRYLKLSKNYRLSEFKYAHFPTIHLGRINSPRLTGPFSLERVTFFGWRGSVSNMVYLQSLKTEIDSFEILEELCEERVHMEK